jgi:hypothetical protein
MWSWRSFGGKGADPQVINVTGVWRYDMIRPDIEFIKRPLRNGHRGRKREMLQISRGHQRSGKYQNEMG